MHFSGERRCRHLRHRRHNWGDGVEPGGADTKEIQSHAAAFVDDGSGQLEIDLGAEWGGLRDIAASTGDHRDNTGGTLTCEQMRTCWYCQSSRVLVRPRAKAGMPLLDDDSLEARAPARGCCRFVGPAGLLQQQRSLESACASASRRGAPRMP